MFCTFNPLLIKFIKKTYYDNESRIQPKENLGVIILIYFTRFIKLLNIPYSKNEYLKYNL